MSEIGTVELVFVLLLLFIVGFGLLARKVGTPYPIVMVIGGLILGFVPGIPDVTLNPDLIFLVVLPPLLISRRGPRRGAISGTTSCYKQAFGRVVAVGNTFYYIYSDMSSSPTLLDTYTAPQRLSPGVYCAGASCGKIFAQGVSTSSSGDIWFSMLTYSGSPNRTLPLSMIALYRAANGNSLGGFVEQGIDPTTWRYGASLPVCNTSCFAGGDFFRIASNAATGASLPFIHGSTSHLTDLDQAFVQDPDVGMPPVPGLTVGPVIPFGSDSTYPGTLDAADIAARTPSSASSISSLIAGSQP